MKLYIYNFFNLKSEDIVSCDEEDHHIDDAKFQQEFIKSRLFYCWTAFVSSSKCNCVKPKFHLARLDSTRSTCRAHAFWLSRASRTAQLDSLDTTSSTGSTRRARQARLAT